MVALYPQRKSALGLGRIESLKATASPAFI